MPNYTLTGASTVGSNVNANTDKGTSNTPATTPVTTPATTPVTTPATDPVTTPVTTPVTSPVTNPNTATEKPVQGEPRSCKLCTYYTISELGIRFGLALFLLAAAVLLFRRSGQQPVAQ